MYNPGALALHCSVFEAADGPAATLTLVKSAAEYWISHSTAEIWLPELDSEIGSDTVVPNVAEPPGRESAAAKAGLCPAETTIKTARPNRSEEIPDFINRLRDL